MGVIHYDCHDYDIHGCPYKTFQGCLKFSECTVGEVTLGLSQKSMIIVLASSLN